LILAEALAPSFGVLGIGGVIALVVGSLILVDTDVPGMEVSYELIGAIAAVSSLALLGLMVMVGRSMRRPRVISSQAMVGRKALVRQVDVLSIPREGEEEIPNPMRVGIDGELWNAWCQEPLSLGQEVTVVAQKGLLLQVEPIH
jgi:membrane-bound serine protease (ClpP class)